MVLFDMLVCVGVLSSMIVLWWFFMCMCIMMLCFDLLMKLVFCSWIGRWW